MSHLCLVQVSSPLVQPTCFVCAWGSIGLLVWHLAIALQTGIAQLQWLHSIPCSRCIFFTGHDQLKCTVHPAIAFSEAAIGCPDCELTHSSSGTILEPGYKS